MEARGSQVTRMTLGVEKGLGEVKEFIAEIER